MTAVPKLEVNMVPLALVDNGHLKLDELIIRRYDSTR